MARKRSSSSADSTPPVTGEELPQNFEESLDEVQKIVRDLESGKLTLDQALARYESGVKHLRNCFQRLSQVESRLRLLVDIDEQGIALTQSFQHAASFAPESTRSATRKPSQALFEEGHDGDDSGDDRDDDE